ncbi:host attachment protein [Magnetovibrio sp.]|uniref:host attachment protein n=1 Tax=Magnetovibrio sp. TaxID=2024836 RepID=UPI002F94A755
MKARKTWILVADGARARIVQCDGPGKGLALAMSHDFAASHAPTRDFGTDKPGRSQGGGVGAHHAVEPKVDWHTYEKHLFAAEMAKTLEQAHSHRAFDDLVLVAPPKTLGDLRKALDGKLEGSITAELGKDLTHLTIHELGDHLEDVVRL